MTPVVDLFCELAAVRSPSWNERPVADMVLRYLRDLGLDPLEDGSGAAIGSDMGNIYVRLPGTVPGTPIFLCAHLDTVPPVDEIVPVINDGVITNEREAILGGDNKSAVAVMLEAARIVLVEGRDHAGLELLFTSTEEVGLLGAYAWDASLFHAKIGYVYDQAAAIGEIILGAPSSKSMEITFHGRAAHAGMFPEDGRSAIAAASRAIAEMRLGRLDEETTANVGTIKGGTAGNVVPEWCTVVAEARSHDDKKLVEVIQEMQDAITFAANVAEVEVQTTFLRSYQGYRFSKDDHAVSLAAKALAASGYEVTYALSGGGSDANAFNEHGLECVNLANAMVDIHTPDESIAVADLDGMLNVTLALLDAARD